MQFIFHANAVRLRRLPVEAAKYAAAHQRRKEHQSEERRTELFCHEKGAFTNALYRRIGGFEEASGGAAIEAVARALQERVIARPGSNTPVPVDIRLMTATSCDLEAAVSSGTFREDLYYRQDIPGCLDHSAGAVMRSFVAPQRPGAGERSGARC
jgi:hypothetical protein